MSAQNPKPGGALGAFLGLIGFSALAGVLVTAMVTPALAVTSVTANSTVGIFEELPDYLEIGQLSQRNTLWATQGGQPVKFAQMYNQNRQEVTWENVSQFVKDATVAGEDERFYEHGGVDVAGIARAAINNVASDTTQGASTLTQQLVKNILIADALNEPDPEKRDAAIAAAQETSFDRKIREAKYAIALEKRYTKEEILLGYLNIAGFGGNTYGIESAAQLYYSTTAKDLNLAQAASLVAIVQNPNSRRLDLPENWESNKARRDLILGNMLEQGKIDQAQYDEAFAAPVNETTVKISAPQNGCLYATAAKHFCDYVLRNVKNLEALGATEAEREANWRIGGYNLYTTLDLDAQAVADGSLARYTPPTETRFQLGSALSSIEVGTGRIRVMAQNKIFDNRSAEAGGGDPTTSSVNFNTDFEYGGSTGFQTGSAYKLFTLVNWLQNGHGLNETVNGAPARYNLPAKCGGPVPYLFKNDNNGAGGRMSVMTATAGSVNAAFANMASKLDVCEIRDTAASMGVHRADGRPLQTNATMILGTDEIAPMTMANAYATVAGGGILCQPIAVDRIVDSDGRELVGQAQNCSQAIAPEIAVAAAYALQGVMRNGTGVAANPRDGTPLIGKTGTADAVHTFLAASSTKVATAAWIGNIEGQQSLRRVSIGGINGGQLRFRVMREMLASINAGIGAGAGAFGTPARNLLNGSGQAVPNVTGRSLDEAEELIEDVGLEFVDGGAVASELPAGQVVSTDPGAGSIVSRGSEVVVRVSDGTLATTMPEIVGKPVKEAAGIVSGAGIDPAKISVTYAASSSDDKCRIVASDPAAGAAISKAAAVSVTVGGGELVPGVDPSCS